MHTKQFQAQGSGEKRRGAAAVEFAVVAPLFFLLLAGIVEFGQAFRIQHSLSTAARRGARAAIIEGSTYVEVIGKVKDHCVRTLGKSAAAVEVGISVNGQANADLAHAPEQAEISVTVSIPYSKAGVGFYANTFANTTLSSTCTLERE